jgi:uncharacterized membrane protein
MGFMLPARIASHYDLFGRANGWSGKDQFITIMAIAGFGLPTLFYYLLPSLPISLINIPNKRYWASAEHQRNAREILKDSMLELATILVGLFAGLNFEVIYANEQNPAAIPAFLLIAQLVIFLGAIGAQVWFLMGRFRIPSSAPASI